MGGRQSTATTGAVGGGGPQGGGRGPSRSTPVDGFHFSLGQHHPHQGPSEAQRHRSVSFETHHRGPPVFFPPSNGGPTPAASSSVSGSGGGGALGSPGSDDSTPDDDPISRAILGSSLPLHLFSFRDIKCPVCSKLVPPDDVECHFVMCLTRPRINYNEDVLLEDKDECAICFEELLQGETIARLPCLCIYHKRCIDQWFKVKRSCPEHPDD